MRTPADGRRRASAPFRRMSSCASRLRARSRCSNCSRTNFASPRKSSYLLAACPPARCRHLPAATASSLRRSATSASIATIDRAGARASSRPSTCQRLPRACTSSCGSTSATSTSAISTHRSASSRYTRLATASARSSTSWPIGYPTTMPSTRLWRRAVRPPPFKRLRKSRFQTRRGGCRTRLASRLPRVRSSARARRKRIGERPRSTRRPSRRTRRRAQAAIILALA